MITNIILVTIYYIEIYKKCMPCIYLQAHTQSNWQSWLKMVCSRHFISAVSLPKLYTCEDFLTGTTIYLQLMRLIKNVEEMKKIRVEGTSNIIS